MNSKTFFIEKTKRIQTELKPFSLTGMAEDFKKVIKVIVKLTKVCVLQELF